MTKRSEVGKSAEIDSIEDEEAHIEQHGVASAELLLDIMRNLHNLQQRDIDQQLEWRPKVLRFSGWGLAAQNVVAFGLVGAALFIDKLEGLSLVFSTLMAATLLQTAFIARIMVKFLFSHIDYHDKEYSKWIRSIKSKK